MSIKPKYFVIAFLVIEAWLVSCRSEKDGAIINRRPRFTDRTVGLEKLYTIDVTNINMFGREPGHSFDRVMDFDRKDNLYILDTWESRISVFDRQGRFVRSFGRSGQGPKEFTRPSMLFIRGDRIYVLHKFGEFKIMNLEGEFVSSQRVMAENPLRFIAVGNDVFLFSGKTDPTFTQLDFILRRFDGGHFDREKVLSTFPYPPGFNGPSYNFSGWDWLLISASGDFYFPEDNLKMYSIVQYDPQGRPLRKFGRPYGIREYSRASRDRFFSAYGRQVEAGSMKYPPSPPVVRKMFQDHRKNLWVVSGETMEDNEDPEFENTVDVFSPKGEWLYSFRSKSISRLTLCHDGQLFTIRQNPETFEQQIDVYAIKY